MKRWLLAALLAVGVASTGGYVTRSTIVYVSGHSNFNAATDCAWPGDNVTYAGSTVASNCVANRGWFQILKYLAVPGLTLAAANNSLGGTSIANLNCEFACYDGAEGSNNFRTACCSGDDATGDQECDLANDSTDDNDGWCVASSIEYSDAVDGVNAARYSVAIVGFAGNECNNVGMTSAEQTTAAGLYYDNLLRHYPLSKIIHFITIWPWARIGVENTTSCANLLDETCGDADVGGTSCALTLQDHQAAWNGRVTTYMGMFDEMLADSGGQPETAGQGTVHASVSDTQANNGIHTNPWGARRYDAPHALRALGVAVRDQRPPKPQVVISEVFPTAATVGFATPVVDPDGDDLECVVWAVPDGEWEGSLQHADRVHNGANVCRALNSGTPCTNCGDASNDAHCNVAGMTTDATASYWLLKDGDPIAPTVPDGDSNNEWAPDLFLVPGAGTGTITVYGLATDTTYRAVAGCMPDISQAVVGPMRVDSGLIPSDLDFSQTFTTLP